MKGTTWALGLAVALGPAVYGIVMSQKTASSKPQQKVAVKAHPGWSKAVNGLVGRLVVRKVPVTASGSLAVMLELKNVGSLPIIVQVNNPLAFDAELIDATGKPVTPALHCSDLIVSPEWGVVPRGAYLGFRVTDDNDQLALYEGASLDTITAVWKLNPGKYRLRGRFSSEYFIGQPGASHSGAVWSGEFELPPVEVEVLADD